MKRALFLLLVISSPALSMISDADKAAFALCESEWSMAERWGATDASIASIVDDEMTKFKRLGYSFSDFGIDEGDYRNVSIEGGTGMRKIYRSMKSPFAENKEFFRSRQFPVCMSNVKERLAKQ
ncbi:hypothetical protein JMY81_01025 [Brenneria goodwinii]|uniref:hypothetical protein n=1 Tax=Brenneria goodwinii TaxID=1109412 RepID=UPI00065E51AD|nr:hypothetical protein [Brenneria goodwinii]MCG8155179.1 hypothetical protein [Brenneria goodwinii]MCG8159423.1 hypothetical protein [Brenneria goodwinii]MCG8164408.1 hypothetical protein [Brenneria goodwinii]MCG8169026.1 hypothetical protein [Brenneria goodwinii]MCG8173282.1 hypothetical protein [Brenneria goodwinii]